LEKNKYESEVVIMITDGKFGKYGGIFVPELIIPALEELEKAFLMYKDDEKFNRELDLYLKEFAGRPTTLYYAENLSKKLGCKIYLKREDMLHTGAHKINNTIGQGLLAKYMGKNRIIAETGAGQHGIATSVVGAMLKIPTEIYMGSEDVDRQKLNVFRMELSGGKVIPVETGSKTLKDAINQAFRDWITNIENTHYLIGSTMGPHPYPTMVKHFQRVIGNEAREQILKKEKNLPDTVIACVGGGSNAMGIFSGFIEDKTVELIGVEGGGDGVETPRTGATLSKGTEGVLHGSLSFVLQDNDGQISEAHSISAGLDYPGVGPEHANLKVTGRANYVSITNKEALRGFELLSRYEGIIPALESSHAVAYTEKYAMMEENKGKIIIINLSGRGDKDMFLVAREKGVEI
jgi:tryptophan synthase beta chain